MILAMSQHALDKKSGTLFGVVSAKIDLFSCHLHALFKVKNRPDF